MTHQPDQPGFLASGGDHVQQLRYNLFQSCSWLSNLSRKLLQPFEITPKQYSILCILAKKSPESLSIQEVRENLADKMSDASRLIDRLQRKGLLEKFPSDFDRRSNRTRITDAGMALLRRIAESRTTVNGTIRERLSAEEIDQLNQLLTKLKESNS